MSSTIFGKPLRIRRMQCDVEVQNVFWRLTDFGQVLYIRVRCHGAADSMDADMRDLHPIFLRQDGVDMVAFMATPSLPESLAPPSSGALSLELQ